MTERKEKTKYNKTLIDSVIKKCKQLIPRKKLKNSKKVKKNVRKQTRF